MDPLDEQNEGDGEQDEPPKPRKTQRKEAKKAMREKKEAAARNLVRGRTVARARTMPTEGKRPAPRADAAGPDAPRAAPSPQLRRATGRAAGAGGGAEPADSDGMSVSSDISAGKRAAKGDDDSGGGARRRKPKDRVAIIDPTVRRRSKQPRSARGVGGRGSKRAPALLARCRDGRGGRGDIATPPKVAGDRATPDTKRCTQI